MALFSLGPPSISGGSVVLYGEKYRLDRVLYAYRSLIDLLTVRFGGSKSYASAEGWDLLPEALTWPFPAQEQVEIAWKDHAKGTDVLGSCVVHRIGPLEAYAYVLGRDCATYAPEENVLRLVGGTRVEDYASAKVNAAPCVELYGLSKGGEMRGMGPKLAEDVQAAVQFQLQQFGFVYTTNSFSRGKDDVQIVSRVTFPHELYGEEYDWLRVRCVAPDGSELVSARGSN